jgi:hypothetical protein
VSEKQLLHSGMPGDAMGTGLFGRPLATFHSQIVALVSAEIGKDAALVFAEPALSDSASETDWYTPAEGVVRPFAGAPPDVQERAGDRLHKLYDRLAALRDRCLASPQQSRKQLGAVLAAALSPPLRDETYLVGDHIVTLSWAFGTGRDTGTALVDTAALAAPDTTQPEPPMATPPASDAPRATAPAPDPPAPAADIDAAGEAPPEIRVEIRRRRPPDVYAVAGRRWFRVALAAAAGFMLLSAVTYGVVASRHDTARALRAERETGDALRLKLAALRQDIADRRLRCNKMQFPRSLSMLAGKWINQFDDIYIEHTDVRLRHHLTFDTQGNASLVIVASNGDVYKTRFKVRFVPNVRLDIVTGRIPYDGPKTPPPLPIDSETWVCVPDANGLAKCHIESGNNKFNDDFVRE